MFFRSNLTTPGDFAEVIWRTAKAYNEASILIEYENMGPVVAKTLLDDYECDSVLHTASAGRAGKRVTFTGGKTGIDLGLQMTLTAKAQGCSLMKLLIEQNQYIVNDYDTIYELSRFSRKGKTYQAEEGCNDDLAMALVVFAWLSNQAYFKELTNIDTLMKLRDKTTEEMETNLVPFGIINRGDPAIHQTTAQVYDQWVTQRYSPEAKLYSPYVQTDERDDDNQQLLDF